MKCSKGEGCIGDLIFEAVKRSFEQCGRNVHFGSFMLLIPLIRCWGETENVKYELMRTTYKDSLAVLNAFRLCSPRVIDVKELSLKSEDIEERIVGKRINLYEWLKHSPDENVVARELVEGYRRSVEGKNVLLDYFCEHENINEAIVYTYHHLLSSYIDPLVISKHGIETALEVLRKARDALIRFDMTRDISVFRKLDEEFIKRGINPGSIADLTVSSIYLALKEGLKF